MEWCRQKTAAAFTDVLDWAKGYVGALVDIVIKVGYVPGALCIFIPFAQYVIEGVARFASLTLYPLQSVRKIVISYLVNWHNLLYNLLE